MQNFLSNFHIVLRRAYCSPGVYTKKQGWYTPKTRMVYPKTRMVYQNQQRMPGAILETNSRFGNWSH